MEQRLTVRELAEWTAYYSIEPFGEERADLRMGILASIMANAWRGKGQKAFRPKDFMPDFNAPQRQEQTVEQQKAMAETISALMSKGKTTDGDRS